MPPKLAPPDEIVAQIAARQHGVVSLAQLYWAGLNWEQVRHRVRSGRLHRIHRGVYAVGRPEVGIKGRWKAATLALGERAALSHRSAAELWKMVERRVGLIDVSVWGRSGRATHDGLRIHRPRRLTSAETTLRDGISVTTPRRTLADLRLIVEPREFRDAIRAAEIANLPIGDYSHLIQRTRSELELMFLELVRRHRLPEPGVNVRIDRFLVDFLWRERKLIVETDGHRYHRGQLARATDLHRDHRLRALGFEVLRLGYWAVVNDAPNVVAQLRARL
jgi:very-short-patch-repair endonuclease